MLVFSMVILLITKINSEHVVIEPKVIDEAPSAKYLARSKDLLSRRKQQEIHKVNKLVPNFPNEVLPVDSENEFPLDFEEGKALLENRDAEIGSSQNKAIKRFVPNNDSIFSPLLQRRNGNDKDVGDPTSVVHLKRENKGNRIKTKAKKRKRDIFDASKTNIRSIKTDREEVLSDLIELKPALDELFDEQNYKNHDTLESLDQKPHRECAKKHKINLPIGYTESVLSEEGEEEEIMLNPNQPSNAPSQLSENEISYKDEKQELHSPSGSSSNSQENTSNATNESKTQTVKREFVNINTKNTVTSHHKASTAVNAVDDIKFCLHDRPNKTELADNQDNPDYSLVKKGTTKDICETILQDISRGKQLLGQSEDISTKGEPKSTDKKINQLLKKLAKTTTNPNILKTEINSKQRLKLGETNTSKAPLLQRILGGQSIQKSTKKPSQALGTEACIMIKTHPRRHKGGDPGNHFLHGKLITTVVCETAAKTSEHVTVSHDEDKLQAAHQQTFAPEMITISAKTCKNNICEECKFNDLKDILPQPPGKNYRYIVN